MIATQIAGLGILTGTDQWQSYTVQNSELPTTKCFVCRSPLMVRYGRVLLPAARPGFPQALPSHPIGDPRKCWSIRCRHLPLFFSLNGLWEHRPVQWSPVNTGFQRTCDRPRGLRHEAGRKQLNLNSYEPGAYVLLIHQ